MHVFTKPNPSPLSKQHPAVTYIETGTGPATRDNNNGYYSPPLTSSLHSRGSATSAQESAYLRQAHVLKWARLSFSSVLLIISLAVVVVMSHVLQQYNNTIMPGQFYLALWPLDTNIRPSLSVLVPAVLTSIMSLTYIAFSCIPTPRSHNKSQTYLFLNTILLSLLTTLVGVVYTFTTEHRILTSPLDHSQSISSWTCTFLNQARDFSSQADDLAISIDMSPLVPWGFDTICTESLVGKYLSLGLLLLEGVAVVVAFMGVRSEKGIKAGRIEREGRGKSEWA